LATPCFFDFPAMPILLDRGQVATDDPTLQAAGADALSQESRPKLRGPSTCV
jgi:hypothetical protein